MSERVKWMKRDRYREAPWRFTLVELLVIVAIISILASMLLPALKSARDKTKRIECGGQLKQIGLAVGMYSGENDGWIPQAHRGSPDFYTYQNFIQPMMGIAMSERYQDIFACPVDEYVWKISGGTTHDFAPSYGLNQGYSYNAASLEDARRLSHVKRPSQKILIGEPRHAQEGNSHEYTYILYPCALYRRHKTGCNVLFFDGHVSYHRNLDEMNDTSAANRDLRWNPD